jgi:hypothetical protein
LLKTGIALRSTVFNRSSVAKLVKVLDSSALHSVWFPSVGPGFDALEMSRVSLKITQRLFVGTGVIGSGEHDPAKLVPRVQSLEATSSGRFVLGLGTGTGTGHAAIEGLLKAASDFRDRYIGPGPPIFFAALKRTMLLAAFRHADGAILNFCSPGYVGKIVRTDKPKGNFTLSCYIKLFFAGDISIATRMLVEEMKTYNNFPQYRSMFEEIGVSRVIDALAPGSSVSERLMEISLANPTDAEIQKLVDEFRNVGVDLPILYPYVSGSEEYKASVVERLASLAA